MPKFKDLSFDIRLDLSPCLIHSNKSYIVAHVFICIFTNIQNGFKKAFEIKNIWQQSMLKLKGFHNVQ
ncbi:MAG: hypothetical protein K8R67_03770 [Desulfobacteraceae bacterium]|nr:hypothetical protein [Desulfobacteraceae bacterium]